jgi:hypothetical protein
MRASARFLQLESYLYSVPFSRIQTRLNSPQQKNRPQYLDMRKPLDQLRQVLVEVGGLVKKERLRRERTVEDLMPSWSMITGLLRTECCHETHS